MKKKTDFSEYGQKNKLRVMDFAGKTPIYYDKKMTTILLSMEYLEFFAKKSVDPELKQKMLALIDETLKGFIGKIDTNRPEYKTILDNIIKINQPDFAGNLIEANEFISIQLTTLRSKSGHFRDKNVDLKKLFTIPIEEPGAILAARAVLEVNELTQQVIPVYSSSATIGLNTILFSVFNDLLPVGIGENPHVVHDNWLGSKPIFLLVHDYGHNILMQKSKQDSPESYEQYKKIYFELFENKKLNKIDDKTFKTHLLVLFFLVYDSANAHPFADFKALESTINAYMYLLISDYKTPLEDLGYVIGGENSKESLRKVLLGVIEEFLMLHPELKVSPLAEPIETVVPEAPVISTVPENKPVETIAPPDPELELRAKKNEYIIKPVIDLFEQTNQIIVLLLDINNPNYQNLMNILGRTCSHQSDLEAKVRGNTILDSIMVTDTISDVLMDFKKAPTLRRLLKTANPSFDFDKEYAKAIKNVDTRHQEVLNSSENTASVCSHSMFKKKEPSGEPILDNKEVNIFK